MQKRERGSQTDDRSETAGLLRLAEGSLHRAIKDLKSWMERSCKLVRLSRPGEQCSAPPRLRVNHPRSEAARGTAPRARRTLRVLRVKPVPTSADPSTRSARSG